MSYNGIIFLTLLCLDAKLSILFVNSAKKQWSIIDKIIVIYYNMVEMPLPGGIIEKNFEEK